MNAEGPVPARETRLVDIVHIGFPKTATTWLQAEVIPAIAEIAPLGKPYLIDPAYRDLLNRFCSCNALAFDALSFRDDFRELEVKNTASFTGGRKKVISFELLSGELYSGIDAKELLDRLYGTFGPVRLLITIREQKAIIESLYRHYVTGGGALEIRDFLFEMPSPAVDGFSQARLLEKFRYDWHILYCQRLFGSENVKVLPMEVIVRDGPEAFMHAFLEAAAVEARATPRPNRFQNESLSYLSIAILRWINLLIATPLSDSPFGRPLRRFYYRFINRALRPLDRRVLARISPRRRFVDRRRRWFSVRLLKRLLGRYRPEVDGETVGQAIDRAYAEANARTAALIGIDLAKYGYPMPSGTRNP